MRAALLIAALLLVLLPFLLTTQTASLDNLYQSNRWFDFRDAMQKGNPSAFYRGELALAFHDWPAAEKEFNVVLKSAANPVQAFEAGLGLQQIYALTGRRKEGRALLARMDQLTQSNTFAQQARDNFAQYRRQLLDSSSYPDQMIVSRGSSRLFYSQVDNKLIVPLLVNNTPANYMLDTGAQESFISRAEARRLGLTVHQSPIGLDSLSTHPQLAAGVTVAPDVVIGNFHFRNVLFGVLEDDGLGGIIGLPLIMALQTLRWSSDGTMEFGFPAQPVNIREANMCVAGILLARGAMAGRPLEFVLDLGSFDTSLFPRFARDFPQSMAHPLAVGSKHIGNDVTDPQVTTLPEVTLRVGGLRTRLAPALVLSREWGEGRFETHGMVGMDLLGQARSVTLDFGAMKLTLDGVERHAEPCDLPPDFLCPSGWTCSVKRGEDGPCFLNRLPQSAWPGNPVTAERGDDSNCILSAGASCETGTLCRAVFDSNQSCHLEPVVPVLTAADAAKSPASPASSGVAPPSTAQARDIVRRLMKYDSLDTTPARDYIYLEEQETKQLNKDGSVKQTNSTTREVFNLYDGTYSRLIQKDGKDLPPDKARAEQAKFDKAVDARAHESPEAKAKRQEADRKRDAESLTCEAEILNVFEPRILGAEDLRGRPNWVVQLDPKPNPSPRCPGLKTFAKFRLKIWVDQRDYRAARIQAENIAPVTWGAVLVRVPAEGLHVEAEQQRFDDGTWLELMEHDHFEIKALMVVPFRMDVLTMYSGYRKFQADSRILPVGGN